MRRQRVVSTRLPRGRAIAEQRCASIRDRLGKEPDETLAKEIGIQRSFLRTYRMRLGIATCPRQRLGRPARPLPPQVVNELERLLRSGLPLGRARRQVKLSQIPARKVATMIGWDTSWVTPPVRDHVGSMKKSEVVARVHAGESLAVVAERAGVSRERIRQMLVSLGDPGVSKRTRDTRAGLIPDPIAVRKAAAAERREQRRRDFMAGLTLAKEMWAKGKPTREIADAYGLSTSKMSWRIHAGRKRLKWFPHRIPQRRAKGAGRTK